MLPVRVFFVKNGCAAYISHLDVQRAVIRGIQRSGFTAAFTEGFNPHIKLVFAMPLSLYQNSEYEIFDFTVLDEGVSCDDVKKRLCEVFPQDIMPFDVQPPVKKLSELTSARYRIEVTGKKASDLAIAGEMVVTKRGKNGDTQLDIRPMIRSYEVSDTDCGAEIDVVADCGSKSHLNVAYICEWLGLRPEDYTVTRTMLHDGEGCPLR